MRPRGRRSFALGTSNYRNCGTRTTFRRYSRASTSSPTSRRSRFTSGILITHVEHSLALAPHARGLTDQIERACAAADYAVGVIRQTLERKGLLDQTLIVLYGDHGDDCWTHGYKGGMIHGTEPYTEIIATPFARGQREFAYAQNFTANQPDRAKAGIAKAFAITNRTYTLMACSRGLEMYAHRLDPGNHFNLLHFFSLDSAGRLVALPNALQSGHAIPVWKDNPGAIAALTDDFYTMRAALGAHIDAKRAYISAQRIAAEHALDRSCLARISTHGRDTFFRAAPAPAPRAPAPTFEFAWKLR